MTETSKRLINGWRWDFARMVVTDYRVDSASVPTVRHPFLIEDNAVWKPIPIGLISQWKILEVKIRPDGRKFVKGFFDEPEKHFDQEVVDAYYSYLAETILLGAPTE